MTSGAMSQLLTRLCITIFGCALSACQTQLPKNGALNALGALPEVPANALMLVIEDPRSERRRRNNGNPGYSAKLAYADDPALARAATEIAFDHSLQIITQWPLRNLAVHCLVIEQPSATTVKALQGDQRIKWLQPFNNFDIQSAAPPTTAGQKGTSVASSFMNHRLNKIGDQGAGVRIAVIDTSIDTSHPDLSNSMVRQFNFAGDRGHLEAEAHGTAVVGLIAAMPATPSGVSGFAQQADVQVLRACWQAQGSPKGKCNTLTLALALDAAIDLRPDVVNLSLTGQYDRVLEELLGVLLENGSLVIAAWDDNRAPPVRFPTNRTGVVYAYGSDTGGMPPRGNVLSAPRHALSLAPMAGYDLVSGHSIAAPQISALAARLINRKPNASRAVILEQLKVWLDTNQIPR